MHLSLLALWSWPTAFSHPSPTPPALVSGGDEAHTGLGVTQGTGVGGSAEPLSLCFTRMTRPPSPGALGPLPLGNLFLTGNCRGLDACAGEVHGYLYPVPRCPQVCFRLVVGAGTCSLHTVFCLYFI